MSRIGLNEVELDRLLVISQVKDRVLTQSAAGEQLGISDRQVRRLVKRYKTEGTQGIRSKHKGGNRLFPSDFKQEVLKIIGEKYKDFGPTFACEKLSLNEGLKLNKETLRQWMIGAGLWRGRTRKKARIHQSRERRPRFGELIQIDGSPHDWFEGRAAKCCLLAAVDDATSMLVGLSFEASETTLGYMRLVKQHIETYGRPIAYYSDKHAIFKTTREQSVDRRLKETQFHRAIRSLQIDLICAHSPQAKGRVERANQTLQDRLTKELRLRNISSIEDANAYLPEFMKDYNERFGVEASNSLDAHRPLFHDAATLKRLLSIHSERKLSKNLEFSFNNKTYRIVTSTTGYRLRYKTITVCEHLDGSEEVLCDNKPLNFNVLSSKEVVLVLDTKEINAVVDGIIHELPTGPTSPCPI
jgi:transposase